MKGVSVYGAYEPVYQRYWIKRKDGVKQRYWKKTERMKKVIKTDSRFEFTGSGRDLYKAVIMARRRVPHGYVDVDAGEFLDDPDEYRDVGIWVDWDVVS